MTELDKAVIAYRNNPTDANRAALMNAQGRIHDEFLRDQTADYIGRQR